MQPHVWSTAWRPLKSPPKGGGRGTVFRAAEPREPARRRVPHTGIWIELERCVGCEHHGGCTWHSEEKYDWYEQKVRQAIAEQASQEGGSAKFEVNLGPCLSKPDSSVRFHRAGQHHESILFHQLRRHKQTGRWLVEANLCYPRIGAFEVYVCCGRRGARQEVFSKLDQRCWPEPAVLAMKVSEAVADFGGWHAEGPPSSRPSSANSSIKAPSGKRFSGMAGKQTFTDEDLCHQVRKSFSTLVSAWRTFDKDKISTIDRGEFARGLRACHVDLPQHLVDRIWNLADKDGKGRITFKEFSQRLGRSNSHCHSESFVSTSSSNTGDWGPYTSPEEEPMLNVSNDQFQEGTSTTSGLTLLQLARNPHIMAVPLEELTVDLLRARLVALFGNLSQAFRYFDPNCDSDINYEEWVKFLPRVLSTEVPLDVCNYLWHKLDADKSSSVSVDEFRSDLLLENVEESLAVLARCALSTNSAEEFSAAANSQHLLEPSSMTWSDSGDTSRWTNCQSSVFAPAPASAHRSTRPGRRKLSNSTDRARPSRPASRSVHGFAPQSRRVPGSNAKACARLYGGYPVQRPQGQPGGNPRKGPGVALRLSSRV